MYSSSIIRTLVIYGNIVDVRLFGNIIIVSRFNAISKISLHFRTEWYVIRNKLIILILFY